MRAGLCVVMRLPGVFIHATCEEQRKDVHILETFGDRSGEKEAIGLTF